MPFVDMLISGLALFILVRLFVNMRGASLGKIKYPKVQCGRCGNCCRLPEIPVTHKDLARLMKFTGRRANQIVRFCSDSEMEFAADSGLWISFKSGKKAMVLRKKAGRCMFQTPKRACSAYEARPQTCRTFPYSVEFEDVTCRVVSEIDLNTVLDCNAVKCSEVDIDTLVANVRKENREDKEYHKLIKAWNKMNCWGTTVDFLQYLGF
jgi:Fe-S-cluster containining protein